MENYLGILKDAQQQLTSRNKTVAVKDLTMCHRKKVFNIIDPVSMTEGELYDYISGQAAHNVIERLFMMYPTRFRSEKEIQYCNIKGKIDIHDKLLNNVIDIKSSRRMNERICYDCKRIATEAQLPWHHHPDNSAWLCATCYQTKYYYASRRKFKTREERYAYLSNLFRGNGNPMYDKHINIGRTYTEDRNRRVSEAVKKWAAEHPEHYYRMGTLGASKTRELGLNGIPTKLEQTMEEALKKYNIHYVPQYKYTIGFMDFYVPDSNIAVFVDGSYWHADPRIFQAEDVLFFGKTAQWVWQKDLRQENYLKSQGCTVLRFWEKEIYENVDVCIKIIQKKIDDYKNKAIEDQ